MKIVFFATYYEPYLQDFYSKNNLTELSYQKIYNLLLNDNFGTFGLYTRNCCELGEDAHLIIANCKPLQQQWAIENNLKYDESNWIYEIAMEQIKSISPDIFFIGSMFNFYGEFLEKIKKYTKKMAAWTSCVIPHNTSYSQFSLVLTSLPTLVDRFRNIDNVQSELLLPAFDQTIYRDLKDDFKKVIPFSFVGGISGAHTERIQMITKLAKSTPIQLFGYGFPPKRKFEFIKKHLKPNLLISKYQGESWGNNMFKILGSSQITFNSHIDIAEDRAANMRLFEATGMGTLLLTDYKSNLNEIFEIDKEVIAYKTISEAIEKVNYYLNNLDALKKIAEAGQKKTFELYNMKSHVSKMLEYFQRIL